MDLSNKLLDLNLKYDHPLGGYSPKELEIDQPGINRIFLDECGGEGIHFLDVNWWSAHTHKCPLEPLYNSICLLKNHLRNSDGTLSDIFWHEYGHVITEDTSVIKLRHTEVSGVLIHEYTVDGEVYNDNLNGWQDIAHGDAWKASMRKLNKEPTRVVSEPY